MPGGGAEIFSPRLAKLLRYTGKADPERWCEIHGIAHGLGIPTNATMLYGHVETLAERVDHLLRLREQQDASGGFLTFVPLAYQVATTKLRERQTPPTDSLRTIAIARLLLDNFAHVEAYWVVLGEETTSIALHFGADNVNANRPAPTLARPPRSPRHRRRRHATASGDRRTDRGDARRRHLGHGRQPLPRLGRVGKPLMARRRRHGPRPGLPGRRRRAPLPRQRAPPRGRRRRRSSCCVIDDASPEPELVELPRRPARGRRRRVPVTGPPQRREPAASSRTVNRGLAPRPPATS